MAENYYYSSLSGDEIEQTLLGAVRFNTDQSLTTSQKAAARANIGAGEANSTFKVLGYFNTLAEMQAALQTLPNLGDAYGIGTESPYDVYVYAMHMVDGQAVPGWVNQGPIDTSAAAFDDEDISTRTGWTSSKIASELTNVQRRLVIDAVPTLGSGNPVASGGVAVKMEWKKLVFESTIVPVNRWVVSTKYEGYGYRAQLTLANVTDEMIPEVIFDPADVSTGTFATTAESYNGGIYIYASEVPSAAITIPTIIVWRGDTGDGSDIPVIQVDPTLTVSGAAADAKAAGDAIRANTTAIDALQTTVDDKAGALVDTASGAIASFVPDSTIPDLLGVTVAVEPVQAGSGDPSPDNVRPISGWNAVSIWNEPTHDTSADPTVTIQLGQTVYGCKLTIDEDGSVTALVDRAAVDLGTLAWTYDQANTRFYSYDFLPMQKQTENRETPGLCSIYPVISDGRSAAAVPNNALYFGYYQGLSDKVIYVKTTDYSSAADFKTAMSGVTLVYPLATPIEITLDPATISTISGQTNNVWSDAGAVEVEFAADIKAYIDRLNQPTEDDMIANTLIEANKYFTVNNKLYLSTASIAAGAQIIPGTNCTETSLVEALNALNA